MKRAIDSSRAGTSATFYGDIVSRISLWSAFATSAWIFSFLHVLTVQRVGLLLSVGSGTM